MARAGSGRTLPAQSISTVVEEQHGVAPAGHRLDDQSNTSAERKRRNGRFGSSTINGLSFRIPSSAFRVRASRAPAVRRSLQNSVGWGQHPDGLPMGAWQTSDAPALQAGPSGSVTRRPPSFALIESQIGSELRMAGRFWTRSSRWSARLSAGGVLRTATRVQAPSGPPSSESRRGALCQGSVRRVPHDPGRPDGCPWGFQRVV